MTIVFRYDDFSADAGGIRDPLREQIWQAEQAVDALFAKYQFPYLVGIIPGASASNKYPGWVGGAEFSVEQDSQKVLWLQQAVAAGRIQAAQHGFCHQENNAAGHNRAEFREVPLARQKQDIQKGKAILTRGLNGLEPTVFVPPFNGWDDNTARALLCEGFSVLSANRTYYYEPIKELRILPFTLSLQQLEKKLDSDTLDDDGILVVLYHPIDIFSTPAHGEKSPFFGIERFDNLLSRLSHKKGVEVTVPSQLIKQAEDLSWQRYWNAYQIERIHYFWTSILPSGFCPGSTQSEAYRTANHYSGELIIVFLEHGGLLLLAAMVGGIGFIVWRKMCPPAWFWPFWLAAAAIIPLCIFMESDAVRRGFRLTAAKALPAFVAGGFLLFLTGWKCKSCCARSGSAADVQTAAARGGYKTEIILGLCVLVSLVIHAAFMLHGFGETDACELGNMAMQLHKTGYLQDYSYRIRTSVLYVQFLKWTLDVGLPPINLPQVMNGINVAASSFLMIPLYIFWRRIADSRTAVVALVILNFAPGFWIGSIYGMPHIPAILFFVLSLLAFDAYLGSHRPIRYLHFLNTVGLGLLAVGCKAELMLALGLHFLLVYRKDGWKNGDWAAAVITAGLPVLFVMTYPQIMFPTLTGFHKFARDWHSNFPFTVYALLDAKNIASTVCCLGISMSAAVILLWFIGLKKKIRLDVLLFVLIWSVPLSAFWALRLSNSARHMVFPMTGLLFYAAAVLCSIVRSNRILAGMLFILIGLNYFLCPDYFMNCTCRPSSKIFQSPKHLQANLTRWHGLGRQFAESKASQKILFGSDYSGYAIWETFCYQRQFSIDRCTGMFVFYEGNQRKQIRKVIVNGPEMTEQQRQAAVARYPEWEVWEWDYLDNNKPCVLKLLHTP